MHKMSKLPLSVKLSSFLAFPILIFAVLYFALFSFQPKEFSFGIHDDITSESYIDPNTLYYFTGAIECYPKVIVPPLRFDYYDGAMKVLSSLDEIRQDDCINGENYIATIRFFVDAPTDVAYSMIFPAEFCEYIIFINGVPTAYTETFRSEHPVYPSPQVIDFPQTEDGMYSVIIYIITPVGASNSSNGTILFGSSSEIHRFAEGRQNGSIVALALIIVTIIFCLIQLFSMQKEKIVGSFIFLTLTLLVQFIMSDSIIIMKFFRHMPFEIGTLIASLGIPLYMIALMYHEYCFFPSLFRRKFFYAACILQIIPIINSLTLGRVEIFNVLMYASFFVPYALCIFVILQAYTKSYPYSFLFSLGLFECIAAGTLELVSVKMPLKTSHSYLAGFITFAIIEMIILAKRYATQHDSELFYSEELNRTIEAMQASENAFLNAQMKPHFLYNTLNTIADLCVTDPAKAKKLIESLKEFCSLILSIDNMDKTVPLTQEMELVTAYTDIEKERFPNISFYTDFPIRMPKIDMPPLILQPLIENAIKHGVRKSNNPGVITLRVRDSLDEVTFYISDNGTGMTQETMEKLFEQPKENKSIGVYNIDKRLKNLYKKGLAVDSTPNLGTCVSFTIPKS
ncbi:MAG: histidine kinase [Lachnospiraceae bacterium]|nr:histidine kinase [Lachnospiraceae bacterium]